MRPSPLGRVVFYTLYLAALAVFLFDSRTVQPSARLLPVSAIVLAGTLLVVRLVGVARPSVGAWVERLQTQGGAELLDLPLGRTATVIVWWLAGAAVTYAVGYLPGIAAFTLLFPWLYGRRTPWAAALFAAGATTFIYYIFQGLMRLQLFPGVYPLLGGP